VHLVLFCGYFSSFPVFLNMSPVYDINRIMLNKYEFFILIACVRKGKEGLAHDNKRKD
jgi:hypothetical protein